MRCLKLLIVEDDRAIAQVLSRNLKRQGFETETAFDGGSALGILKRQQFDFVLCDYQLPDMSGRDLCHQIRLTKGHENVPIAFCTAKAHEIDTEQLTNELGLCRIFLKPFSLREITQAITETIRENCVAPAV